MDDLDNSILELLREKKFVSPNVSALAKSLHKPVTTIHSRVKRLQECGILKGFSPQIEKMGEKYITAFMLLKTVPGTDTDSLGRKLAKIPEVEEVFFVTGEWYYLIKIKVRDMDEYYKISGETLVKNFSELTEIVGLLAPKAYRGNES